MKKEKLFFIILFLFLAVIPAYALDWKRLHEEAGEMTLEEAVTATQNNPASVDALYTLGLVYLDSHKNQEAGAVFKKIISLDPQTQEAKWGLAEAMRRNHDSKESETLLGEVMRSQPDFSPAYITLAYIKYIQMDFAESVRLATRVVRQGRENVDSNNFSRAYLLIGGGKGMLAYYGGPLAKITSGTAVFPNLKKAQKLKPDSAAVFFGLGSFYFLAPSLAGGNREKAREYLEKAIDKDPLFADAYVRLSQVYRMNGQAEKADAALKRALEIDPRNTLALDAMGKKCKFICISMED